MITLIRRALAYLEARPHVKFVVTVTDANGVQRLYTIEADVPSTALSVASARARDAELRTKRKGL